MKMLSAKKINRERRRAIMHFLRKKARITASFIDESIIDSFMPSYIPELAAEAACLIDVCSSRTTSNNDINFYAREALACSVAWFKKDHHMEAAETFKSLASLFKSSTWSGGVGLEDLNPYDRKKVDSVMAMMQYADPSLGFSFNGLGDLALKILDRWDILWDENLAYESIELMLHKEHLQDELNPLTALEFICNMEREYLHSILN